MKRYHQLGTTSESERKPLRSIDLNGSLGNMSELARMSEGHSDSELCSSFFGGITGKRTRFQFSK